MGFENEVEQSVPRPCRQIYDGFKLTCELTSSSSREGHHSTTRWISSFLLLHLILHGAHATAVSQGKLAGVSDAEARRQVRRDACWRLAVAFGEQRTCAAEACGPHSTRMTPNRHAADYN